MGERVSLRPLGRHNVLAVCALELADGQERYVAPAAITIAEAAYEPDGWLRAIYLGETPVGVVFVEREAARRPLLVRLMIAATHQRQGIGRQVVRMLAEHFAQAGASELLTSYVPGPPGARRLLPDVWLRGDRPGRPRGAGHQPEALPARRQLNAGRSLPRHDDPLHPSRRRRARFWARGRHGNIGCLLGGRHARLQVYPTPEQGWFCFGCRRGGTIYDLAAEIWGMDTRGPDFVRLRRRLRQVLRDPWRAAKR